MPGLRFQSDWIFCSAPGNDDGVEAEQKARQRRSDGPEKDASFHWGDAGSYWEIQADFSSCTSSELNLALPALACSDMARFAMRLEGHRHVGQAVAGEDLQPRAVAVDGQALLAVAQRGRRAMVVHGQFLLRRVVADRARRAR